MLQSRACRNMWGSESAFSSPSKSVVFPGAGLCGQCLVPWSTAWRSSHFSLWPAVRCPSRIAGEPCRLMFALSPRLFLNYIDVQGYEIEIHELKEWKPGIDLTEVAVLCWMNEDWTGVQKT